MSDTKYYQLLKEKFKTKENVLTEIINLEAIMELPKGTEHFVSDLHGEFLAFNHVMRNGSGSIKEKVKGAFAADPTASVDIDDLAVLIYYPTDKLHLEQERLSEEALKDWYRQSIEHLLKVLKYASIKYTRKKVRKTFPKQYRYIMDELLYELNPIPNKQAYYESILQNIVERNQAPQLIRHLAIVIQQLTVDHLHVVGDIYDRGPAPDQIMDRLMEVPSIDIQWGNHDMIWLGILAGSYLCMMSVLRISARYGNLGVLEERYGINLRPLFEYATRYYAPKAAFTPKQDEGPSLSQAELDDYNCVQQATMILQAKLETQLYRRRPEFKMDDRDMLSKIDVEKQTINLNGKIYTLKDFSAPTLDPSNPSLLTDEEQKLLERLLHAFRISERFERHMRFMLDIGSLYLIYNGNLLIHGCLPLEEDGHFQTIELQGKALQGRSLYDFFERQVYQSFQSPTISDDFATDCLWYLWCGPSSPLFGKHAMKTFERYYIDAPETHREIKNPYYALREQEAVCVNILEEFDLATSGHIINGHTPIREKDGENPVKGNGRLICIDGGYSKPYHRTTGIAGYTLLSNSWGMQLVAHQSFVSPKEAVERKQDVISLKRLVERVPKRTLVKDTTIGSQLKLQIEDLNYLYQHYEKI